MAKILCIANSADTATYVGHVWMQKFANYASSKGHQVVFQNTPTLPVLYEALLNFNPQLVVANGHGGYKSLRVGENILIGTKGYDAAARRYIRDSDTDWFQGRIVLMLTCNAGVNVVPSLVKAGAVAAMGYRKPYVFFTDENAPADVDPVARPFFEALYQPAIRLADGATFKEAVDATRASFEYYIQRDDDASSRKFLQFNEINLIALGDPSASLN